MRELVEVTCPSCFEVFSVAAPESMECPSSVDYDCEVCCRPMVISFWYENGSANAVAQGLDD